MVNTGRTRTVERGRVCLVDYKIQSVDSQGAVGVPDGCAHVYLRVEGIGVFFEELALSLEVRARVGLELDEARLRRRGVWEVRGG